MAVSRSARLAIGRVTRGLVSQSPDGGAGLTIKGLWGGYLGRIVPAPAVRFPLPAISTQTLDSNGTQRLLSDDVVSTAFYVVGSGSFGSPDIEFTGYASDGFWHTLGSADPTHIPFKATWAQEGEGPATEVRGTLDRMPARLLILATKLEVVLLDADTLDVWMRLLLQSDAATGVGRLGGTSETHILSVHMEDGILFMATTSGLRVADFRNDQGLLHTSSGVNGSRSAPDALDGGLAYRNNNTYLDGFSSASAALVDVSCLSVHARSISAGRVAAGTSAKESIVVCVVGHVGGVTALTYGLGGASVPTSVEHVSSLLVPTSWSVVDDSNGNSTTPTFVDYPFAATNWIAKGVRVGDILEVDSGTSHRVSSVTQVSPGNSLKVSPELGISQSGASYLVRRVIASVLLSDTLDLYLSDGVSSLGVIRSLDWFVSDPSVPATPLYQDLNFRGSAVPMAQSVFKSNALALHQGSLYAATDLGVFLATDSDFASGASATFQYSTSSVVGALYPILVGPESNVADIAVDPETGHVLVAVTDFESVTTEIDTSIQQAFRFFDSAGRVKSLTTFRNANGPPDTLGAL